VTSRRPWLLAILPAVLVTAGCFQGQRTIHVKADGSGTITDTLVVGEQMKAMMAMAEAQAKDKEAQAKEKAKNEAAAQAMGPGVTFVSEEKTASGVKTVFAFKDIASVKVGVSPGPDSGDSPGGKKEQPLAFKLARQGNKSVLTVVQPQPAKAEKPADLPAGQGMQDMGMAMWSMMKPMMKGLMLKTVLEVEGTVVKTTSPYATGSTVTLLELDFDKITADEANFKKFTKAGEDPSTLDPKLLQGVKGIKVSPAAEVVIEFTGK
jgi:hypothetical protein